MELFPQSLLTKEEVVGFNYIDNYRAVEEKKICCTVLEFDWLRIMTIFISYVAHILLVLSCPIVSPLGSSQQHCAYWLLCIIQRFGEIGVACLRPPPPFFPNIFFLQI